MKYKKKHRKNRDKNILIRFDNDERRIAKQCAKEQNRSVSDFFRNLMKERKKESLTQLHFKIIQKYKNVLKKHKELLDEYNK